MEVLNMVVLGSLVCAICGVALFCLEVIQGRMKRYTRWSEMTLEQWIMVCLALGGTSVFVISLIVSTILKG
jgi:hypothetical protein